MFEVVRELERDDGRGSPGARGVAAGRALQRYEPPRLTAHGTLAALTQQGGNDPPLDSQLAGSRQTG